MTTLTTHAQEDPFLWLENVDGEKALEWVNQQNAATTNALTQQPEYQRIYEDTLKILNSKERIAYPGIRGNFAYNFWQDETYPRGVWRRTELNKYLAGKPEWEDLIDFSELSEQEGENWSFKGVEVLKPGFDICLVKLSRGGGDAVVVREFDINKKAFVEGGFKLPEAKTRVAWLNRNTLLVGTDFGERSMTDSGYPRIVKKWKRGILLKDAEVIYEGKKSDVSVGAYVQHTAGRKYVLISRGITFYETEYRALKGGKLIKLDLPKDAEVSGIFKNHLLVQPKKEWKVAGKTLSAGSLVALNYDQLLQGKHEVKILFQPSERESLGSVSSTENQVLVNVFKGGRYDELFSHTFENETWKKEQVKTPEHGTLSMISADDFSDRFFLTYESMLTPRTLYFSDAMHSELTKAKSLPAFFDAEKYRVEFQEAVSKDGTKIPYTVVLSKTAKLDGSNPTLLYGYGGFEISLQPHYSPVMGTCWLAEGGIYVVANIRGGGEFGPKWHQAAQKENKQRSYDDFIAVSEDLIQRGYCTHKTLGIQGGSNGGLLVGAVTMQRPDLYNAVVCAVPLLDMKRFNKLLAGASWMGEYGNPDLPEEWAYISKYSPYQNLSKDRKYPKIFFKTSTRDDRVHPGHARKMAAKMESYGQPFFYYENTEGGHGAGVTNEQRAMMDSLGYAYLLMMLK
ncbi:prolyl oligopeptidase family serine peptidase [Pontiellaceae bacterium B12219]|nr:prolyl oligopeptidase family serine peptidase [Pontiellaceae bacterium B12219]